MNAELTNALTNGMHALCLLIYFVAALLASVPAPDILVNCAGWVHDGTILDCDDDVWDRSFGLNAKAIFRLTKAVLPGMLDAGSGSIVNIASIHAHLTRRGTFPYAAAKAGVVEHEIVGVRLEIAGRNEGVGVGAVGAAAGGGARRR